MTNAEIKVALLNAPKHLVLTTLVTTSRVESKRTSPRATAYSVSVAI